MSSHKKPVARSTEPPVDMLPVEDAVDRILSFCRQLPSETRAIDEAVGQVLATDITAPFDIPPHDNTAMDGYAVQSASTDGASESNPVRLRVIGELAAGYLYEESVGPGEAVRIMTRRADARWRRHHRPVRRDRRVRLARARTGTRDDRRCRHPQGGRPGQQHSTPRRRRAPGTTGP